MHRPDADLIASRMLGCFSGSSVGALNGAYYAGNPTIEGIERLETIWRRLRRNDVFPLTWKTMMSFLRRRDFRESKWSLVLATSLPSSEIPRLKSRYRKAGKPELWKEDF